MKSFSCFDGGMYSSNKFNGIEEKNGNHVCNIIAVNCFGSKNNGDRPPESETVHEQQGYL